MVSFEVHQTLKIAARTLMPLAVVAAPYTAFSQPAFEPVANDEQRQMIEKVQEEQSQHGPYSAGLIAPLTALGLLYQEHGDHDLAAVAIERALQAVRINNGLHSLDQVPLILQAIRNEEARGNLAAAWDLEQELLTLARRYPDDLRTVQILREIADKRMHLLTRYLAGDFPPQIILGGFYGPENANSGSRSFAAQSILSEVWRNYADAIRVILRHELYASDELRELEMGLVRSSYRGGAYQLGRESLRRLLAYDVAKAEPWLTRINALIQMADWDLRFGHNGLALETYEQAYEQLKQKGIAQAAIDQIFSPKTPVVLPAFFPNPLASDETQQSTGYIDVTFEVTKYGKSRRIEILDTTTNATDAAKDRLVRVILRNRFRPRVTGGQFANTSPTVVRYYLNE